jgi:hypothetical protein
VLSWLPLIYLTSEVVASFAIPEAVLAAFSVFQT